MQLKRIAAIVLFILTGITSAYSQASSEYIDLCENAPLYGMELYWDPLTQECILEKNGHAISFSTQNELVLHDYNILTYEDQSKVVDGRLMVTRGFLNSAENYFSVQNDSIPYRIGAILIDPGHGGKDPGANSVQTIDGKKVNVIEKDINLKVGLMLFNYLKQAYPEKRILMTRSTDVFITLAQRTDIANSVELEPNEAILYVSIHVNSSLDPKASGYEAWYLSPGYRRQVIDGTEVEDETVRDILNGMMEEEYTTESILIAKFIMDGIGAQVGKLSTSRGIKAEEWFVVANANMPSVLVEVGFLSNPTEAALLCDEEYLKKLSFGIYNGLQAFVTHFERSRGFTGQND